MWALSKRLEFWHAGSTILSRAQFLVATPQQEARTGPNFGYALNLATGNYEVDLDLATGLFNTSGQQLVLVQVRVTGSS
jgi:hypothetical protein